MDILIEEYEGSLWAAAIRNGRLEGLEVDPLQEEVRWGSVYWGKIKSFDAALDAAYVALDIDNTGILYNKDTRIKGPDGTFIKGGEKSISKSFKAGDMIAVQAKTAYLPREHDGDAAPESKIPQLSMDITLPGRHMIYCPLMNENRLSQRIRDKALRKRIHKMLDSLEGMQGLILRAAAANTQTDILTREAHILQETWEKMQKYLEGADPGLIMLGPDAIQRTLSDQAGNPVERIEIVTMDHYKQAEEWCSIFAPDLVPKIQPLELKNAQEDFALFDHRDIIGQIEDLFHDYVLMDSGSSLIIQTTAALTAIDVNRGGSKRSNLAVNLDAIREIARQIRLRNTGGIIVIDFLKSQNKKAEGQMIAALEDAVSGDPCTVQIHGFTALGLMEVTRNRRTPPLAARLSRREF